MLNFALCAFFALPRDVTFPHIQGNVVPNKAIMKGGLYYISVYDIISLRIKALSKRKLILLPHSNEMARITMAVYTGASHRRRSAP